MRNFEGYLKQKFGDSYILLAGGGHKALSDIFTDLSRPSNTNNISITVGGVTKSITLGSNAWSSDSYHSLNAKITRNGGSYSWYSFQQYNSNNTSPSYYADDCAIINIDSYSGWLPWIRGTGSDKASWCIGQYTTNLWIARIDKSNTKNELTLSWLFAADGSLKATKFIGALLGNADTASDSAKLNGYASDTSATANTIVRRQANGYIYAVYYNASNSTENISSYTAYPMFKDSNGWQRCTTKSYLQSWLGLGDRAYDSTSYLPLTGGTLTGQLTVKYNSTYPLILWGSNAFAVMHLCDNNGTLKADIGWLNDNRGNMVYVANIASTSVISTDSTGIYWSDATSTFKKYTVYHSNNANLSTVDWTCKGLAANNTITIRTTSTGTYNMLNAYATSLASGSMTTILFGKNALIGDAALLIYKHNNTNDAANKLLLGFYSNYEILTITNGGNVGINQTSPTEKLHIVGNELIKDGTLVLTRTTNENNRSKRVFYETNRQYGIKYDYAGHEALIISSGTYTNGAVKIYSSNGLTIDDSDGQYTTGTPTIDCKKNCVAINYNWAATTPGYNLYVNGTSYTANQAYFASHVNLSAGYLYLSRAAALNSALTYNISDNRIYARLGNNSHTYWLRFYSSLAVDSSYNNLYLYFPGGSISYSEGATDTLGYVDLSLGSTTKRSAGRGLAGRLFLYSTQDAGSSATVRYCYFVPTVLTSNRSYTLPDASGTVALTSDLSAYLPLSGGTMTGGINLNRSLASNGTGIEFYDSSYNSWQIYMHAAGSSLTAGWNKKITTVPSGTYVTSWALRSVIEGGSGYGWTWESMAARGTGPAIIAELSSNNGNFKTIGNVYAINFYTTSDVSKKKNIQSISYSLPLVSFNWKKSGEKSYGFIALELQKKYPELVDGEDGSMTVNYNAALSLCVAILSNKVTELENEIKLLKKGKEDNK